MRAHLDVLGWLFVAYAVVQLVIALLMLGAIGLMGVGFGWAGYGSGQSDLFAVGGVLAGVALGLAVLAGLLTLPAVYAGLGIRARRPGARIVGFAVAGLGLTNVPLGTLFGIYAIVVLADPDVAAAFRATGDRDP